MKKIFILTGEPSGDKLASTVISNLKFKILILNIYQLEETHIKKLGIQSIFDLKEIYISWFYQCIIKYF